ncbi:MAG: DUF4271 domain-containing protein [Paramuribaculum sp.]|nr:DUF4271 domain-containing protein [Paramuribaculum sp.]
MKQESEQMMVFTADGAGKEGVISRETPSVCREDTSPYDTSRLAAHTGRVPYTMGMPGNPRPVLPGYDSGIVCMLLGTFLLITLNFRHHATFVKTFAQDLLSVRRRSNAFEDHTLSETGALMSLILLACVSEGLLLFTAFRPGGHLLWGGVSGAVAMMIVVAMIYYIWQVGVYSLLGYVFTDRVFARHLVRGFNASQALLGLVLAVPALAVTYRPSSWGWVAPGSIMFYFLVRGVFIYKGFRIFYINYFSSVYFIVYLCSLEIVPLIVIMRVCRFLIST